MIIILLPKKMKVNYERFACFGDGKCGPEIDEVVDVDIF